ncbi:Helicase conserved C-terminal domain-containing protein [Desulforamulus aeronauticus DSM 10349]|uniref:Helicase conserved C-terminal domain-containing protein n=1 Tax=Desulforamulus aeronauticus DSM 10349 TaxID=1121421 RepID=A0A1M6SFB3_9FIRM|nr:Helicase conserved C-terminal domain-containing protein [Desulforamulus aeronauticus DSM 10349]
MVERAEVENPSIAIESVQDHLPALYFVFGRIRTEELAAEIGREWDFLFQDEKEQVHKAILDTEKEHPEIFQRGHRRILRKLLQQGIGYHHAGLSPVLKNLVERLYENRLLWVLFCTETFAAGVNFPAATTLFHSCRKWDGKEFRTLMNREFFQMAGRAGRRGFDRVGHVYIKIDDKFPDQTGFFDEAEVESVYGRLTISPNTVLSLLKWKTDDEIDRFLTQNFSAYQERSAEREIKGLLGELDTQYQQVHSHFCELKGDAACPLQRRKLIREQKRLRSSKYKNRPGSLERILEIRQLLADQHGHRCLHEVCADARDEIDALSYQRAGLVAQLNVIKQQSQKYIHEYHFVKGILENLGYINGREFFPRGNFALELHVQEIFVTELAFSGLLEDLPLEVVAGILAGVDYIPGRREFIPAPPYDFMPVHELKEELLEAGVPPHFAVWAPTPGFVAHAWYTGQGLDYILENTSLQEGDIVSIIRRLIDLLRQIDDAAHSNPHMRERVREIRRVIDRDEVAVVF